MNRLLFCSSVSTCKLTRSLPFHESNPRQIACDVDRSGRRWLFSIQADSAAASRNRSEANRTRRVAFLVVVWACLPWANYSNAAVIQRNWKTPGDGLLTYDDVNQREWLDLSVSLLNQFPAPQLPNAVAEIGAGGRFDGFAWGRKWDVLRLAQSAGINVTTGDYSINQAATRQLIELLGVTLDRPPFVRSAAFIDPTDFAVPAPSQAGVHLYVSVNPLTGEGGIAGVTPSSINDLFYPTYDPRIVGLFLFRPVPEPDAVLLAATCLCVSGLFPRSRRNVIEDN